MGTQEDCNFGTKDDRNSGQNRKGASATVCFRLSSERVLIYR